MCINNAKSWLILSFFVLSWGHSFAQQNDDDTYFSGAKVIVVEPYKPTPKAQYRSEDDNSYRSSRSDGGYNQPNNQNNVVADTLASAKGSYRYNRNYWDDGYDPYFDAYYGWNCGSRWRRPLYYSYSPYYFSPGISCWNYGLGYSWGGAFGYGAYNSWYYPSYYGGWYSPHYYGGYGYYGNYWGSYPYTGYYGGYTYGSSANYRPRGYGSYENIGSGRNNGNYYNNGSAPTRSQQWNGNYGNNQSSGSSQQSTRSQQWNRDNGSSGGGSYTPNGGERPTRSGSFSPSGGGYGGGRSGFGGGGGGGRSGGGGGGRRPF